MPPAVDLFAAGVAFAAGGGLVVAVAYVVVRGLAAVWHAIRWHVWRPILRRRYLKRVEKCRDEFDRAAAMRRHPAGRAAHPDAHNRALS